MQIFILAEGLKIEFFGIIKVEKAVWYKLFCESGVHGHYPSIRPHDSEICA